ncbi:hypothetical protein acsn021_20200 [Anaerocolumna cellulosilytica]|uniref:Uncharacterized protein n=1 Tax=Anaerocolumna cellulosilytica TaxID=433286 RepID=A0A6S6R5Y4_9FIRM|nr:DUF3788 family protein [Anaerocolumna cellulosilytica]MBB5196427.1 hypothetical protein [Anaerocolumna cellulosilytica]BCJ94451.1 hypothetical protein acsn021_20200 [Anaerocolumna cellulosilytica]
MLTEVPSTEVLLSHLGSTAITAWNAICDFIDQNYNMELFWDNGGKYGKYVLRFKKSGKTLCTLYVKDKQFECWIILGKTERDKFELERNNFMEEIQTIYDATHVYHDGKWVMLEVPDIHLVEDIKKLILIKKKPNKK